jgi:Icc-related predicted phosphoesterase
MRQFRPRARGRRGRRGRTARLCFVTDVHGSERCFKKFLNAGKFYDVQYLILGGDITGKTLVPIERSNGCWRARYGDHQYADLTVNQRDELAQLIRDNGQYPVIGERDELLALFADDRREQTFREVVVESMRRWMELADERLAGSGIRCFVTPGNDDFWEIDDVLRASEVVELVEGSCVRLDDTHEMITTGFSNITPWATPREEDEDALARRIDAMFAQVEDPTGLVAVLHCPPRGTELDQAPMVDSELRVKMSGSEVRMGPVGSVAVRDFIRECQPLLGLHGHVHESKAAQRIGRTLCLNPGSEYTSGILNCALVTLYDDAEPGYQFTSG